MTLAKIVYASMTGNTEEIADIVAEAFEDLELEVEIDECTQVDAADFEEADICVVATYTYGDGDLPDEIVDFMKTYKRLIYQEKSSAFVVQETRFMMIFVNRWTTSKQSLLKLGQKGADSVKVDLAAEEDDIQRLEEFAKN